MNTDKRQLYWLIDQYVSGGIDTWDFSNKYHSCYNVELDLGCLSKKEDTLFSELSLIIGRFSPYKEDHVACPGFFYTEKEVRKKVVEAKKCLKYFWPSLN